MKTKITILGILAMFMTACSGTPSCSDSDTKDLVIQIAKNELNKIGKGYLISKSEFEVQAIRTREHDKDADTYTCAADFVMDDGKQERKIPITYTIESTDDKEQFYVQVFGF